MNNSYLRFCSDMMFLFELQKTDVSYWTQTIYIIQRYDDDNDSVSQIFYMHGWLRGFPLKLVHMIVMKSTKRASTIQIIKLCSCFLAVDATNALFIMMMMIYLLRFCFNFCVLTLLWLMVELTIQHKENTMFGLLIERWMYELCCRQQRIRLRQVIIQQLI